MLYYGQELGMVDFEDIPPEKQQDNAIATSATGETPPHRDGARTPMQWDDSVHAGFSFGKAVEPWLPVHPNYKDINVEAAQANPDSIWHFYRRLIYIQRHSDALRRGSWRTLIHYPYEQMAYLRETAEETILVIINFAYEQPFEIDVDVDLKSWQVLLSNIRATGQGIDLPQKLEPFEIDVLRKA